MVSVLHSKRLVLENLVKDGRQLSSDTLPRGCANSVSMKSSKCCMATYLERYYELFHEQDWVLAIKDNGLHTGLGFSREFGCSLMTGKTCVCTQEFTPNMGKCLKF